MLNSQFSQQFALSRIGMAMGALMLGVTVPAYAITTADDPANHVVTPPSFFDGVALLNMNGGTNRCSGSLLAGGNFLLTAAHCLDLDGNGAADITALTATFDLAGGSQTVSGAKWFLPPQWNGSTVDGFDIAVVKLTTTVSTITGYNLFDTVYNASQRPAFETVIDIAGYGRSGYGSTGEDLPTGTLRTGKNEVDIYFTPSTTGAPDLLYYDFDNGEENQNTIYQLFGGGPIGMSSGNPFFGDFGWTSSTGLGDQEVMIAPGDSGGPSFIDGLLAGVHSYGVAFPETDIHISSKPDSSFGELGADTQVAAFRTWINNIVNPAPEPGSLALLSLGLAGLGVTRRRAALKKATPNGFF